MEANLPQTVCQPAIVHVAALFSRNPFGAHAKGSRPVDAPLGGTLGFAAGAHQAGGFRCTPNRLMRVSAVAI
jgi:hypothetical protein